MNAPLPADLAHLLAREREAPPPPEESKLRVAQRLGLALPPPAPLLQPRPAVPPGWSAMAVRALLALAVAGSAATWLALRPSGGPVVTPPPREVVAAPELVAPPAVEAEPPAQASAPAPAPAETEISLLRRARGALAQGDAGRALTAVERHRRRWPRGQLVQEREVLAIQALSLAGATSRARSRADQFLERYPASTLAETVRQLRQRLAE